MMMLSRRSFMLYHLYELNQAALHPARAAAEAYRLLCRNPLNPASHTAMGRGAAAALELFERSTRRYRKPAWEIDRRWWRMAATWPSEPRHGSLQAILQSRAFRARSSDGATRDKTPRSCWWRPWRGISRRSARDRARPAARPRCLCHRMAGRALRAARRRAVRPRQLYRLHH